MLAGVLATLVLAGVAATHASSWWDEFRNPASAETSNEPGRFASASSNNRWRWWGEAVDGWRLHKLEGTGAGSFEVVHKRFRDNNQAVTEPHDLPVQFLGETGLVGLLLWGGAFAAALAALFRRPPRAARLALALAPVAFLLHGLLEIDWDFLAVCAPVFLALGTALGREAPRAPLTWRLGAGGVALAGAFSLFSPWLADRYVTRAYDHLGTRAAVDHADRARSLDPLSLDPLLARANARLALGDLRGAYADHLAEIDRQPENPDAWCDVGQFELDVLHAASQAYEHLNRWYTLDSQGPCLDLLDRARRAVNAGG
jgi:tetratricopeptide (TPR) repeat protein